MRTRWNWPIQAAVAVLLAGGLRVTGADFTVTSPGFFYSINGASPNPTLTLVRGRTYTFAVNTSASHPFQILSPGSVSGNDTSSGTITYTVATNAPATNNPGYWCSIHTGISGLIVTVDPPVAPVITITDFQLGTNLVLRSTGSAGWAVLPEYTTNLNTTNWLGLTVQTNRFANGTNETMCVKPSGDKVYVRIRTQPE
jgi:hypothetical protein